MIPIYLSNGSLYRWIELERLLEHEDHFNVVRNKRGHIKRATLKQAVTFDSRPASMLGVAFEQPLSTGCVWALHGVAGSAAA
jgi:hypothetical protein